MQKVLLLGVLLSLGGCDAIRDAKLRQAEYDDLNAYKACLKDHAQDVSPCEGTRLAWQADQAQVTPPAVVVTNAKQEGH